MSIQQANLKRKLDQIQQKIQREEIKLKQNELTLKIFQTKKQQMEMETKRKENEVKSLKNEITKLKRELEMNIRNTAMLSSEIFQIRRNQTSDNRELSRIQTEYNRSMNTNSNLK